MSTIIDGVNNTPSTKAATLDYGYDVAKGNVPGVSKVNKFGYNAAVGATMEPIWDYSGAYERLADDTFATMYISSDDTLDRGLAYTVQGVNSEYNWDSVTATTSAADGFIFVAIPSNAADGLWWRINRSLQAAGTAAVGNIYISKDNTDVGGNGIPDTVTDIQAQILIGLNQTLMALWTVPKDKTAYLHKVYASTSSTLVTEVRLYYRPFGGVFNVKHVETINASSFRNEWRFPSAYAEKGDFVIRAAAGGGGGKVAAGFDLWYE